MSITSIQKVIKIGSSVGVTLPARDLKSIGVSQGDNIKITFEPVRMDEPDEHSLEVVKLTQKLIKRHKQALKNLYQR